MDFRTKIDIKHSDYKISHSNNIMLIGSCFTENIGTKLNEYAFNTIQNPFGIVYNPQSICDQIIQLIYNLSIEENELFFQNEQWHHYHFHSRFSNSNKTDAIVAMNNSLEAGHRFLKDADFLIVTLGTAKIYELLQSEGAIANCHKTPKNKFKESFLSNDKIFELLKTTLNHLYKFNTNIRVILSISPIRHWKDGAIENLKSKSILNVATHQIIEQYAKVEYFPAYEIIMDELRDYRFYKEDMLHPSDTAIKYIWESFCNTYMSSETMQLNNSILDITNAKNHRPFNEKSEAYSKFINHNYLKIIELKKAHPYLNIQHLEEFFTQKH